VPDRRVRRAGPGRTARAPRGAPLTVSVDVLLRGDSGARALHLAAMQRLAGNAAVSRLLEVVSSGQAIGPTHRPATAVAYGGLSGLHGRTESSPDGGKRSVQDLKTTQVSGCDCPAGQKCLSATATAVVVYKTTVTIQMPSMPGGLSKCEEGKVRAFFTNVLRPHEEEHKRRFKTYEGTVKRPIQAQGCGLDAVKNDLDSKAQAIQDSEHAVRERAAKDLSGAIDPFFRVVDFDDCQKH
jgi:hypothetical protein